MSRFFQAFKAALLHPMRWTLWVVLSTLVGLAGPFGTFDVFSAPERILYWAITIGVAIVIVVAARLALRQLFPQLAQIWISLAIALILAGLLTPVIVFVLQTVVERHMDVNEPPWMVYAMVAGAGLYIEILRITALRWRQAHTPPVEPPANPSPRLARRLPDGMGGEILHLNARNHLVDVHTSTGLMTLRLRLSDAINEMEGVPGLCTHRSHWVALSAVVSSECEGNRPVLVLRNGSRVPVSRKYEPDVVAQGLLTR
ncbi:LytTR family DNA-binding domain-containing protein [Aliiroseovarius subalbicans]|uniref:LytTR family DNA-binding domain-containing protein n=1 Tax=Aliiroseovarius subalbicans TaxID=2925840 RepID=UPI001F5845D5|nr:LytTR family DNA-binding domain-containing protein [Aliiroseovarius subalbicans]MCI2397952.1 LytTR family transcriptional regulator [Aliiroseovarius subalbicans]